LEKAGPTMDEGLFRSRKLRIGFLLVLSVVVIVFAYLLRDIFNPLLIALLIAYILDPIVSFLERFKVRRSVSVMIIFILAFAGVAWFLSYSVVKTYSYYDEVETTVSGEPFTDANANGRWDAGEAFTDRNGNGEYDPGYFERIGEYLNKKSKRLKRDQIDKIANALENNVKQILLALGNVVQWITNNIFAGLFNIVSMIVLIPVYTFFLLRGMKEIRAKLYDHLPGLYRERIAEILHKIDRATSSFFRGRLIIAVIKGLLTTLGLYICGVKFAPMIGLIAGILSLIPFAGPIVGFCLSIVFAYDPGQWLLRVVGALVVFVAVEVVEAVLAPILIGREVGLHPITYILSIFIAAEIFGLFGVLLAVPIACIIKILGEEFVMPELRALARERSGVAARASPDTPGSISGGGPKGNRSQGSEDVSADRPKNPADRESGTTSF
jgi:predicted PurR-regulated permease PerM